MEKQEDKNFKRLLLAINAYLKDLLDISHDTNHEATIDEVKA
jgi:hypothetical protein